MPTPNKAIGITKHNYRKNCSTCVHPSRLLVVRYKQCTIALLIQNKLSNAQKHKCCHYGSQTAESFSERNGLPNTLEPPNPARPINDRKWHTGQTDTASMPLYAGMRNRLGQHACHQRSLALLCPSASKHHVALCRQPPSDIHPQGTHMMNQNTRHALRRISIHYCRIPSGLFAWLSFYYFPSCAWMCNRFLSSYRMRTDTIPLKQHAIKRTQMEFISKYSNSHEDIEI